MPVGNPHQQHAIMREAVENQSPDVILVDEISTPLEVQAAKTISQCGVQLIATVHGETLPEILNCKERGSLVGGVGTVTLSGREAERRQDKRKQVQQRNKEPVFQVALELHHRQQWIYHDNVKNAVDTYFDGTTTEAMELIPGAACAIKAIPMEASFDYCSQCDRYPCPRHNGLKWTPPTPSTPLTPSTPPTDQIIISGASLSNTSGRQRRSSQGRGRRSNR